MLPTGTTFRDIFLSFSDALLPSERSELDFVSLKTRSILASPSSRLSLNR